MKKIIYLTLGSALLACVYLSLAPTLITPQAWQAPTAPEATGIYAPNTLLQHFDAYPLPQNSAGPESIAFNEQGLGVTADNQGQLFKITLVDNKIHAIKPWVKLSGRPLGMQFEPSNQSNSHAQRLIVADAVSGLLSIAIDGTVTVLSNSYAGQHYGFVDDVAVARSGKIYFSDATRRPWLNKDPNLAMHASQFEVLEHAGNGRLFVYNPNNKSIELLLDGLQFANGVTLSAEEDFVLVNETGSYQVRRYWLQGEKSGTNDIFSYNLPGFPDNITTASDGGFWLALIKPRNIMVDMLSEYPQLRKASSRLPQSLLPVGTSFNHVLKLDTTGKVVQSLQDPEAKIENVTSAIEQQGRLFLGSLSDNKIAVIRPSAQH